MKLDNLKKILNSDVPDNVKEYLFIQALAIEKDVIPFVMKVLDEERIQKNELIKDMNLELSRAHIYIDGHQENQKESKELANKSFILDKIAEFYIQYKGTITHCFNRFTTR